jgi:glycosyltransferase involved in cell wall biosynthesis
MPEDIPVVGYFPIDAGPLDGAWIEHAIARLTVPVVYTEFGKHEVVKMAPELEDKLMIIPHGIDLNKFYPISKGKAAALMGNTVNPLDWIVFNGNRNQPRKRLDLTIKGFAKFAEDKPSNVKLYLHTGLIDAGFPIDRMMNRVGMGRRLYITSPNLSPASGVTTERLNWIYNCCDVGINTSVGEGWGLVPFEHAATGAPQIVPDNSASAEVFGEGRGLLLPCREETVTTPKILTEGRVTTVDAVADALQYAYDSPEDMEERAEKMFDYINLPKFNWGNIAMQWHEIFQKVK